MEIRRSYGVLPGRKRACERQPFDLPSFSGFCFRAEDLFYSHTARIDFKTKADWGESQLLLRTSFPLDIQSNEADFEIQFGNVKRPVHQNTTWDQARFEVCAHKWMDLSGVWVRSRCFKMTVNMDVTSMIPS